MRRPSKPPEDNGETIATFGKARIVKSLDGKLSLVDGSEADRKEAREWAAMFLPDKKLREG